MDPDPVQLPGFPGPTLDGVRAAVARGYFDDRPPTRDELYLQAEFGYPVSASVFQWLSDTFGVAAAFEAASDNLSRGFDELFASFMYPSDRDFQAEWAEWVRDL